MMSSGGSPPTGASELRGGAHGRSAGKRRAILDAATTAFVAAGYDATSMDDVARSAAVSKPTIYSHFGDKAGLFRAAILAAIDDADANTRDLVAALPATRDLRHDLRRFARQHLADLMEPTVIRMRRRIIAEAERFPDLASTWYKNGPAAAAETLAAVFAALGERGLLRIDDPIRAAERFNWLVLVPLNRAMFLTERVERDELDSAADDAVDMFLEIYEPHRRGR